MGHIRRQTILSSGVIYIGFVIGLLNTYFYVRVFTPEQYGLTRLISDFGITFFSFASLGVTSYVYKFFPYYKENLPDKENDQLAWSLGAIVIGFILLTIAMFVFKPLFIRKMSERSSLLIHYYYWILPYTAGILLFSLFEAFAWFARKSVLSNFLKETGLRLLQSVLIALFIFGLFNYDRFVKFFSFTYLVIGVILVVYLAKKGAVPLNFRISRVSIKFRKKISGFVVLLYGSLIINTVVQYIDSIIIASVSVKGLADVGIYTLATFVTNTIQVPQRSITAATLPVLSTSWKNKNLAEINRVYHRSSINLLLISLFIFIIIWLSIDDVFAVLHINKEYESGKWVILLLGLTRIIDAGTGVNNYIISTSNYWKFEVFTGIILLCLSIPLNYTLVKHIGITGSAISNLVAYTIYNIIRIYFLYWKFKMQPFTMKTVYTVLVAGALYALCYFSLGFLHNWLGIISRSILFGGLFIGSVFWLKLTPDAHQLLDIGKNYFRRNR